MRRLALMALMVMGMLAALLYAQTAPPLLMKPYEDIYIRDAKRGLCIRLMLETSRAKQLEAWIVPDRECEP